MDTRFAWNPLTVAPRLGSTWLLKVRKGAANQSDQELESHGLNQQTSTQFVVSAEARRRIVSTIARCCANWPGFRRLSQSSNAFVADSLASMDWFAPACAM